MRQITANLGKLVTAMNGYEIVEHTADVGVRAHGDSLEQLFEQATFGLLDISGAYREGAGEEVRIEVSARDLGGVLVDWLSEVLYAQDARDAVVTGVSVSEVKETAAVGSIRVSERAETLEGTAVKAITYHQLRVEREGNAWVAEVYVDV